MGNKRMESVIESQLLDLNLDKSCFMVIGNKKANQVMESKLKNCPLTLCGKAMNYVLQEKYLGDQICSASSAASALATIEKRAGKVTIAIYEIKAIIEDCRINAVGGLSSGLHLWKTAVIPFVNNNSETWTELSQCAIDRLEGLQKLADIRCKTLSKLQEEEGCI